ncbi:MAG: DNA-directed RNA polymerase subunit beta' [Candidatus Kapaibacterium sp.]
MVTQPNQIVGQNFRRIMIKLASSDDILNRSHGEVTKPETINYRSFRPEKDGLFCEKIFGPVRDWECHCGKYKRIRYKGIICDRCGVEVTQKSVRRERMGHIALAVPVVHIWYLRSLPSKIGAVLGLPTKDVERIVYYESYVVVQPGQTGLQVNDLLTEEQYLDIMASLPDTNENLDDEDPRKFIALIGGEAVKELLKRINPDELALILREQARTETSMQKKAEALKRLRVVGAFRERPEGEGDPNRPEWMVLDIIPVIPPELRPLVPLEGGRFATSDLNDLYRRVIIRNNRLKRLIDIDAPEVILRNEKRMLQEAVDSLFDNSRRGSAVRSDSQRALKSLSDMLKGKQGRFRQNLLGKRVDYSGRSVIVVGPEMRLHECGLPKDMAVELFKPFIIRKLIERGHTKTVKSAKKVVERKTTEVWDILESVIDGHPVLLNRAPTLHRLGIQAFQPRLVEGKAIHLHPLVCAAFNADFDGDQMAVHVPLSYDAQLEAMLLMLSSHNIISAQSGDPVTVPSQDMVLGCYYVTKTRPDVVGEGKTYASPAEVIVAHNNGKLHLHARIKVRVNGVIVETSTGRVIFNKIVPEELGYIDTLLTKKELTRLISECFRKAGSLKTVRFLDHLKDLGFSYSTRGGLSVSISDVIIPPEKDEIIHKAQKEVDRLQNFYLEGVITNGERYNKVIDVWSNATNRVLAQVQAALKADDHGFNTFWMMRDSNARGSTEQIRQLAGMRGLMAKPQKSLSGAMGELIENPVTANFKEGLSILEYFISTHGARKGLADTALKTADAGYLTRRLIDVAQDAIISDQDCGTIRGIEMRALKEGEHVKEHLHERVKGRVAAEDIVNPITNEMIVANGELITEDVALAISQTAIEIVHIRSVLTCEAKRGICSKCYGVNLTTGNVSNVGEAVGIIAAQSIGEPGTQLTLRTFHTGGTASLISAQSTVQTKNEGRISFEGLKYIVREDEDPETGVKSETRIVTGRAGVVAILDDDNRVIHRYDVAYGSMLQVAEGEKVTKGDVLYEWDPYNNVMVTDKAGFIRYKDLIPNVTYRDEPDEQTGYITKVTIDAKDRTKSPSIEIVDETGKLLQPYIIPVRAHISVDEGEFVKPGTTITKIPRDVGKTRDITGGLPRVTELFEARSPQQPAVVADIDGIVSFDKPKRGNRVLVITSLDLRTRMEYTVSFGKHVLVQEGDFVRSGERLSDGSIDPHDILRIKGVSAVQEYIVNEIQEVYRMQGVAINDKHIEVIARQMLHKVRIIDSGDTRFLEGDQVDRIKFEEENDEVKTRMVITDKGDSRFKVGAPVPRRKFKETNVELKKKEKKVAVARDAEPATSEPLLLGITQASLTTESFISAASFQETTKVLTDAAVEAKVDNLHGLKENVIMGRLIPAGTGLKGYRDIIIHSTNGSVIDSFDEKEASKEITPSKAMRTLMSS